MSEVQAVATIIDKAVAARAASLDGFSVNRPFALVPQDYKVENMREYAAHIAYLEPTPHRVRKNIQFVDVSSFLGYFEEFREGYQPQIFCNITSSGIEFMAVIDYDQAMPKEKESENVFIGTVPQWNENRANLKLAYHRDYATLKSRADQWIEQEEFALFIEENMHLFIDPDSATMLELAQHLKGKRNADWQAGRYLHNGVAKLEYTETIEAKSGRGDIEVPQFLTLRTPIFEGFDPESIRAAFRWRLCDEGKIKFGYRLMTKIAERKAEEDVKKRIEETTKLKIFTVASFDGITAKK